MVAFDRHHIAGGRCDMAGARFVFIIRQVKQPRIGNMTNMAGFIFIIRKVKQPIGNGRFDSKRSGQFRVILVGIYKLDVASVGDNLKCEKEIYKMLNV